MGAGGSGKTRLALQAAAAVLEHYGDGVWLIDLAPLTQPDLVPHAVAAAVGVRAEPGQPLLETLTSALRPRQLLLLLDNCEHLIDTCARLVSTLIHSCPRLHVLATSRSALGIAGETTWRVPPLRAADPTHLPQVGALTQYEAVRLFIDRAVAVQPHFHVTNQNAPAVAQICHRLDGIPLAIELAAARVRVLSPDQISQRLDDRFHLLTGGNRTGLPRQQTLRALVDWSHDLLSIDERVLFRRLSVFAGGWTLSAAEAVCSGASIDSGDVLDLLGALVDQSLVVADEQPDGDMRYRLLETLREYAAECLVGAGEVDQFLRRHAEYFLDEAERIDAIRKTDWQRWRHDGWAWQLAEQDNLRAVLGRCRDQRVDPDGELEVGLRLCASLWWFWFLFDRWLEGWDSLNTVLTTNQIRTTSARFFATWYMGIFATGLARFEDANAFLARARELAEALDDDQARALAESATGLALLQQGELPRAAELNERSLALARRVGPSYYLPIFIYNQGWTALRQGQLDAASALLDEAIAVAKQLADELALMVALSLRGTVSIFQSNLSSAQRSLREAERISEGLPGHGMVVQRIGLGYLALLQMDTAAAARQFRAALDEATRSGGRFMICDSLDGLASVIAVRGDARGAVRIVAAVDSVRASIDQRRSPDDQRRADEIMAQMRQILGEEEFEEARLAGSELSLDEVVAHGRQITAQFGESGALATVSG
jgi:predicted ATPase